MVHCPVFTSNLNTLLQDVRALLPLCLRRPPSFESALPFSKTRTRTLSLELHGLWTEPTIQKIVEGLKQLLQSSASVHALLTHREDLNSKAFPKQES